MNNRLTISLEELIKYYSSKWKSILAAVIIGMVLCVCGAVLVGEEIHVPPSERYVFLKEEERTLEEYEKYSIIMKMDSMNIYQQKIVVKNVSDKDSLKEYILSGQFWEDNEKLTSRYVQELIDWKEIEDTGEINIILRYCDEQGCDELANALMSAIEKYDTDANAIVDRKSIVSDEEIMRKQLEFYDLLGDVKGELQYVAAGYTLKASKEIAVVIGAILGGMIAMFLLLLKFWIRNYKQYK